MLVDLISDAPLPAIAVVALVVLLIGGLVAITAIVASMLQSYAVQRMEIALKRDMVARGMSPEAIDQVMNTHRTPTWDAVSLSSPSAVVVQAGGEWHDALVLKAAQGRYYVHFVGTEMGENTWVEQDCVRFPADSEIPTLVAQSGFTASNGAPVKEPVEEEV